MLNQVFFHLLEDSCISDHSDYVLTVPHGQLLVVNLNFLYVALFHLLFLPPHLINSLLISAPFGRKEVPQQCPTSATPSAPPPLRLAENL